MKIIRWLLSHTFLVLLIVAVIYGYMFWGNLAGEDTPAGKAIAYLSDEFVEVESFVEAVKAKQAERANEKASVEETATASVAPEVPSATIQQPTASPSAAVKLEPVPVQQPPVNISYSHNQRPVQQNAMAAADKVAENQGMTAAAEVAKSPPVVTKTSEEKFISPEIEQQLSNVDDRGKVIAASQKSSSVKENWVTARKAFYQRDYDKSIQGYKDVIASTEDNFDAYGELGNVYFNQGKNQEAASAYFEAAAILIKKGQVSRAQSLMGLMRHLDKAKAEELQELIESARS